MKQKLILLVFTLILICGYYNILKDVEVPSERLKTESTEKEQTFYTYPLLSLSVNLPPGVVVQNEESVVVLAKNAGTLILGRNSTNFDTLQDYFGLSKVRNNLNIISEEETTINNYNTIKVLVNDYGHQQRLIYYLYTNKWVYTFSTTSPKLYDELDQIVKSFRYTGE